MHLHLEGKIVVVTGASSGIGAEVAKVFAEEGAIPVLVGRDSHRGEAILDEIRVMQSKAMLLVKDLAQTESCAEVVKSTFETFGRLDVLVNNAGGNDSVGLDRNPEAFLDSIRQNLLHVYAMTHYALPQLRQNRGCIVNVGSKVAETGQGGTSGYAAAKGGMRALTREWALDLRQDGIRVNEVIPAEVLTLSYQNWLKTFPDPEQRIHEITRHIPLGQRFTTTREIADMVVFLASDKASHITGQHIYVDGGYTHLDRAIDI